MFKFLLSKLRSRNAEAILKNFNKATAELEQLVTDNQAKTSLILDKQFEIEANTNAAIALLEERAEEKYIKLEGKATELTAEADLASRISQNIRKIIEE